MSPIILNLEIWALQLSSWSDEQRKEYFESFADKPAMVKLSECGSDPLDKISSFISMTDEELDEMTRLMLVISQDPQGSFLQQLRGAGEASLGGVVFISVFKQVPYIKAAIVRGWQQWTTCSPRSALSANSRNLLQGHLHCQ